MKRLFVFILVAIGLIAGAVLIPRAAIQAAFAIQPGKILINNMYPGGITRFPITIFNDAVHDSTYSITVRAPDYTDEGYEPLSHPEWVRVEPADVAVASGGNVDVIVTINIPKEADYSDKRVEIWLSFIEQTPTAQTGAIPIEVVSRVLINIGVASSSPWPIVGAIAIGVIAVAALVFYLVRKRQPRQPSAAKS